MLRDAARVVHQHSERYIFSVGQTIKPSFAAKPSLDLIVEGELAFRDKLKCHGREVRFADASSKHPISGRKRLFTFYVGKPRGHRAITAIGQYEAHGRAGKLCRR